jgi:alcohol dehydrogenase (cytochrome c)
MSVTDEMLLNPAPEDWLMFSRTYDNQRFSPLDQINRDNVSDLKMVWARAVSPGVQETIPIVHKGIMYVAHPGAGAGNDVSIVQALDATNGDLIWEYRRDLPDDIGDYVSIGTARVLSMYRDKIFYGAPDGYLVALGADNGELHWEVMEHDYHNGTEHTTGPMVAGGMVVIARNCDTGPGLREECFIAGYDANTGVEAWRFNTPAGSNEPGGDTWGGKDDGTRGCAPWGLPGGYNPEQNLVYWGVANSNPHTRIKRHNGNPFAVPLMAPAELYCNSTLALDLNTGELKWYYQHVPGDDWDADWTHERVTFTSRFDPDPDAVRWINPNIRRGEERQMIAGVGEGGGLWVLDAVNGEFLWAMPFPFDTPAFHISDIDVDTGRTIISRDTVLTRDGEFHELICFANIRGYYPMAYHPGMNSLFIPYHDLCNNRTGALRVGNGHIRETFIRPGGDPDGWVGIARVNMETGEVNHLYTQDIPSNGAVLVTAADLVFWGDMDRRLKAIDAVNGEVLWEGIVGGIVQNSTITYAADGRQYIAVITGEGTAHTSGKIALVPGLHVARGDNTIYVFALPE